MNVTKEFGFWYRKVNTKTCYIFKE